MTRLAHTLRHRMQILTPVMAPNSAGGFSRGYYRLGTVWVGLEPLSRFQRINIRYIRDQQIERGSPTHIGIVRHGAAAEISPRAFGLGLGSGFEAHGGGFGRQYSKDFDASFRSFPAFTPFKSDYFMFLENGSGTSRGRLFRIYASTDPQERREQIQVDLEEIENHAMLPAYMTAEPEDTTLTTGVVEVPSAETAGIYVGPIWDDTYAEWQ